jgi:hypothetical protein
MEQVGSASEDEFSRPAGEIEQTRRDNAFRAEVASALASDTTALGDVWRGRQGGLSAEEMAEARGTEKTNWVWLYDRAISAILEGDLPTAPTVAQHSARNVRRLLKNNAFSTNVRDVLGADLAVLDDRASDPGARADAERVARVATAQAEDAATAGIYVYTLPHYLRYPFEPESGHTLFKVGRTDRDSVQRFREQTRTTALPEDPVLLRVYPTSTDSTAATERQFHELLEAADHDRSTARTGGREWFLTSVRFLDAIAGALGLDVQRISDLADYTE